MKRIAMGLVLALGFGSCSHNATRLEVNFLSRTQWVYALKVDVNGSLPMGDSVHGFENHATGFLVGEALADEPSTIRMHTDSLTIHSTMLTRAERQNLISQFEQTPLTIRLEEGAVEVREKLNMPMVMLGGWDLYRTFVRLIPSIPQSSVRPGSSWERERLLPLNSAVGCGVGHLYQSFVYDSLTKTPGGRVAHVSWKFRYQIEILKPDSALAIEQITQSGSGSGVARFDLDERALRFAAIDFQTDVPLPSRQGIQWHEHAEMKLLDRVMHAKD